MSSRFHTKETKREKAMAVMVVRFFINTSLHKEFFNLLDHLRRLIHGLLGHPLEFLAPCRFYIDSPFFGLGDEFRVFHRLIVGVAEDLDPVWRCSRRDQHRPRPFTPCKHGLGDASARYRVFILLHEFVNRRGIRHARVPLATALRQKTNKALLLPASKGFPGEEG